MKESDESNVESRGIREVGRIENEMQGTSIFGYVYFHLRDLGIYVQDSNLMVLTKEKENKQKDLIYMSLVAETNKKEGK